MKHMKCVLIASLFLMAGSAVAADVTEAQIAAEELVHEEQVQKQMELLQAERNAAFMRQLEAKAMILEQQLAADAAADPNVTTAP